MIDISVEPSRGVDKLSWRDRKRCVVGCERGVPGIVNQVTCVRVFRFSVLIIN